MKYLVIVESPAKKQKIQSYLNTIPSHTFIVEASYGHVRYFANKLKSIDIAHDFKPTYSIVKDKLKVVNNLKQLRKKVDDVIIATDLDREGEAIGYHIAELLKLDIDTTKRICFNQITKNAVVEAFHKSRKLDSNLYNAQQTRSIIDLLIGFELSPLLWKYIQPKLSAGRCQSPALRIIDECETRIKNFATKRTYSVTGTFKIFQNIEATYIKPVQSKSTIEKLLPELIAETYELQSLTKKQLTSSAPPPYITSTIQQDASSNFGYSPTITMQILQKLYEKGKITYMRTDSTTISKPFMDTIKEYCNKHYKNLFTPRYFKSKVSNAQEAHECIRPVELTYLNDSFPPNEQKLFTLIMNRTIASQMKPYKEDLYKYSLVSNENPEHIFTFTLKQKIELGYKQVYHADLSDDTILINKLVLHNTYSPKQIDAVETYTKPPPRYTEASLIKELETKGIGRPSTFASIVGKLFQRKYARKETTHNYKDISLETFHIKPNKSLDIGTKLSKSVSEKNKIFITDIGILVCQFINLHFDNINSYEFTSEIENDLDKIATAEINWTAIIHKLYNTFHPKVVQLSNSKSEIAEFKDKKRTLLGTHNDKNVYTYIGKYGPCIQHGEVNEKPVYVSILSKDITIEEAVSMLQYPRLIGQYKNKSIELKLGPHGLYIEHEKTRVSVEDEKINLQSAIEQLEKKQLNIVKSFKNMKILNGPYGPYIRKGTKNVSIPKDKDPSSLTLAECEDIIKNYKPKSHKPKYKTKKTALKKSKLNE